MLVFPTSSRLQPHAFLFTNACTIHEWPYRHLWLHRRRLSKPNWYLISKTNADVIIFPNDDLIGKPNAITGFIIMTNGQSMNKSNTKIYYKLIFIRYCTFCKGFVKKLGIVITQFSHPSPTCLQVPCYVSLICNFIIPLQFLTILKKWFILHFQIETVICKI